MPKGIYERKKNPKKFTAEISKGNKYYSYVTREKVTKCPKCEKTYTLKRKYCLNCYKKNQEKIRLINDHKTHTGMIKKDLSMYMCSCEFSSFWRFGKHWEQNHPSSVCKHFKLALKKVKKECKND